LQERIKTVTNVNMLGGRKQERERRRTQEISLTKSNSQELANAQSIGRLAGWIKSNQSIFSDEAQQLTQAIENMNYQSKPPLAPKPSPSKATLPASSSGSTTTHILYNVDDVAAQPTTSATPVVIEPVAEKTTTATKRTPSFQTRRAVSLRKVLRCGHIPRRAGESLGRARFD